MLLAPIGAEEIEPDLRERHAVDGGELDLQQDLAQLGRSRRLQQIDHGLGARLRHAGQPLGFIGALDRSAEHDGFARAGDFDIAAARALQHLPVEVVPLGGIFGDVDLVARGVLAGFPDDQRGAAGSLGVDHDFAGGEYHGIGDFGFRNSYLLDVFLELE